MARVFIGIGSNINPEENVERAVRLLGMQTRIRGVSTFYLTEPIGRPEQPPFYNGVVEIETDLSPRELKDRVLYRIEDALKRVRTNDAYAARTIDLDILVYDDLVQSADLVLPSPEIARRAFLAVPLHELGPDLVLPGTGRRIADVAAEFRDHRMKPLDDYTRMLRESLSGGVDHES